MTEPNSQPDAPPGTTDAPGEQAASTNRADEQPETQVTPRVPDSSPTAPRRVGPYELLERLGRGGFGEVWLAERVSSLVRTRLAVKIPHVQTVDVAAVRQEAAVWVQAGNHPNVLPIFEAEVYGGQIVIASEYVADGSLAVWLANRGGAAPSVEQAVEIVSGILAGLDHLHARGIVHRDIKPANVLLQSGVPRLADFGLARVLATGNSMQAPAGTPSYMAPEAFDAERSVKTDLWSVGVLLYQLLSGRLPFPANDWSSTLKAVLTRSPDPLPAKVPPDLRSVVARALEKNPANRFDSASDMRTALRSNAPGATVVRATPGTPRAVSSIGLHLLPIPAGEFLMGSANDDPNAYLEERPQHRVVISAPFYLGVAGVSQRQFEAVLGLNPSRFKEPRRPVESVTWLQAIEFCNALSAIEKLEAYYRISEAGEVFRKGGPGFRLPTEAEWEYACRAGTTGRRWFPDSDLDQYAWFRNNSEGRTHSVGRKEPNPWGLRDMLGNTWEWCWDRYLETYYLESPVADPPGPSHGRERVLRGGSFGDGKGVLRCANRFQLSPNAKLDNAGFRIAKDAN